MKFLVYLPGRKENTGGHVVLHKLVKILSDLDYNVLVTQLPIFDCRYTFVGLDYVIPEEDLEHTIVVYPEQIIGNPTKSKNVSRWILYHTSKDVEDTWDKSDEKFKFIPGFSIESDVKNTLTVIDGKLEIFYNKGFGEERNGYCHINKKKYPKGEKLLGYLNSKDLSDFMEKGGFKYLSEEFNNHEYFITYDDATYYSVMAALCGCRSVILNPDNRITPEEYRQLYPVRKYGVAYGWTDLKHADLTRDLLREHVLKYEKNSVDSVKNFIQFWKYKIEKE